MLDPAQISEVAQSLLSTDDLFNIERHLAASNPFTFKDLGESPPFRGIVVKHTLDNFPCFHVLDQCKFQLLGLNKLFQLRDALGLDVRMVAREDLIEAHSKSPDVRFLATEHLLGGKQLWSKVEVCANVVCGLVDFISKDCRSKVNENGLFCVT